MEQMQEASIPRRSSLVYFCPCLNVQLQRLLPTTDGGVAKAEDQAMLNAAEDDLNLNYDGDPFFSNAFVVDASPEEFTVSKKVECLCCTRPVADKWLLTSCLNCRVDAYAIGQKTSFDDPRRRSRIFVSRKMNTDVSKVTTLSQSDDFSHVYEIVVRPLMVNEGQSISLVGVVDERAADLRTEELKRKASAFLDAQRMSTKERISEYKKLQLLSLKQLESRVQQDRNILMQRITSAVQESGGQLKQSTFQLGTARASVVLATSATSSTASKPSQLAAKIATPYSDRNKTSSDVFAMDEDDVFTPSEPEDTGSASEDDDNERPRVKRVAEDHSARLFATSLPVSMPLAAWKGPAVDGARHLVEEDAESQQHSISSDTDHFKTDDPEWMAASIKALAMSVRGDDDLFGARPRPRLNTLD